MDEEEFKKRTRRLGIEVIRLVEDLPPGRVTDVIGRQLLKSATSVGANYRAACRGRSIEDMIAKLKIVEEEADETLYWFEVLSEAGLVPQARIDDPMDETHQILAMIVASIKTLRSRQYKPPNRKS